MTEDERIDEIIRNTASDYNRPPATPRDEMWTAIQAARQTPSLHVIAGGASTGYATRKSFSTRFAWIGMAAAAAILVAAGVGIGRYTSRPAVATIRQNPIAVIADAPAPVTVPAEDEIPSASAPTTSEPAPAQPARRTPDQIRRDPKFTNVKPMTPLNPQFANNGPANANLYQVATLRHLADAEALLTSFSLEGRDATVNKNFADWAKGLLSNTRLLLDSPAGDDPRRAKLLQDLELVLAQIVQLSPGAAATDRELIQGSIQEGQVITRLRTAIPAGQPREILER
jgi:hypothetical protein